MASTCCVAGLPLGAADVLGAYAACARAPRALLLWPVFGAAWADADEALWSQHWGGAAEATTRAFELSCTLLACGGRHWSAADFQRRAAAAASHPQLSQEQRRRLLAAEAAVPAHYTCTINTWLAAWQRGLRQ